ncbi:MAG: ABC transporter ATP-binding protein [Vicinamibacterales bacterium]|jgi:putative ABC transport system ATP-binding protein|nr:ABC transporter ATP-binding protein [Vicinamibacterales bacterium]
MSTLHARDLRKDYGSGDSRVEALGGVSLELATGEFVAVVGPSGCGKSTLLHLCGGMDRASAGTVAVEGVALADLDDDALTRLRRDRVGFVFQFFNLLPTLTLAENIALPLLLAGTVPADAKARARDVAEHVGLGHRLAHYPAQVSGGELQRAAVARAVIHRPALLIADEPTGNLDTDTGQHVLEVLRALNRETRVAVLLATHDPIIAGAAGRLLRLRDGIEVPAGDPVPAGLGSGPGAPSEEEVGAGR